MRIGIMAVLVLPLLAGPGPALAWSRSQASRVRNQSPQAWRLALGGGWVAGEILIRPAGGKAELARLQRKGDSYVLGSGEQVDLEAGPDRNGLALELTFALAAGSAAASIFISQGSADYPPTIIPNGSGAVQVDKAKFGHAGDGAFVLIH